MKNDDAFKKSIERLCMALVGQTVMINWRAPIYVHSRGRATLNGAGVIVFYLDPSLSVRDIYETALHEIGHCLCGHVEQLPRMDMPKEIEERYLVEGPFLERTESEKDEYEKDPRELEAQQLADHLAHLAIDLAIRRFGHDEIESRIIVLSEQVRYIRPEEKSDEWKTGTDCSGS